MLSKLLQFVNPVKFAPRLFNWVKKYQIDILLFIGIFLISLFSFAIGYIIAKQQDKTPIKFEEIQTSRFAPCNSFGIKQNEK